MAIQRITYIDTATFRSLAPIDENIPDKILMVAIQCAQDMDMHPILGSNLHNALLQMFLPVGNETIKLPVNANYYDLWQNYIINMHVWYSYVQLIPFLRVKIKNKGTISQNSENSNDEVINLKYAADTGMAKAQFYSELLTMHINSHTNWFPEYVRGGLLEVKIPDKSNYYSGMYMEDINEYGYDYKKFLLSDYQDWN